MDDVRTSKRAKESGAGTNGLSRGDAAAIARVEGLEMSAEITSMFERFDRLALTPDERITALRKHFATGSP